MHGALAGGEMRGQPHNGVHRIAVGECVESVLVSVRQGVDERVIGT
jgi:hypothetical protein